MKIMSSKEIKDHYGAFAEAARHELVVHTSHGRPTLVSMSIDRARSIPQLQGDLPAETALDRKQKFERLMAMAGIGVKLVGEQSLESMEKRSREFRGNDCSFSIAIKNLF
jgi:hypothetical protein